MGRAECSSAIVFIHRLDMADILPPTVPTPSKNLRWFVEFVPAYLSPKMTRRLRTFSAKSCQTSSSHVQVVADGIEAQELALITYDLSFSTWPPWRHGLEVLRGIVPKAGPSRSHHNGRHKGGRTRPVGWMLGAGRLCLETLRLRRAYRSHRGSCGVAAACRAPFCKSRISSSNASPTLSSARRSRTNAGLSPQECAALKAMSNAGSRFPAAGDYRASLEA